MKMMPNLLVITIDSLRNDRLVGIKNTAKTPNIDFLIKNGVSFSQTISSSDSTGTSIGSIFSGCFPCRTGITHFVFNPNTPLFSDELKNSNYFLAGTFPDVSFFSKLSSKFDFKDFYVYDKRENWLQLEGGIGEKIVKNFGFLKDKSHWFYYIHLMDLHSPFKLPEHYNSENFGQTKYDKMISYIDTWIGKILEKINLSETIVVLSADHGDYIPIVDPTVTTPKNIQKILRKGKKLVPELEPLGVKFFSKTKSFLENQKRQKLKNQLSENDLRTLGTRGTVNLFDELLMIPLIISGKNIPHSKKISNMVRQVDIFPTVFSLAKIPSKMQNVDGRNLSPLIECEELEELPAYIETGSREPKILGKTIGVRTSDFKYWRSRDNPNQNVNLFDLQNDPDELQNMYKNSSLVKKMENILHDILGENKPSIPKIDDEKLVEDELKKLGYL